MPAYNHLMHPRNIYKDAPPDFQQLALEYPRFRKHCTYSSGKLVVDFRDVDAVRELTRATLHKDFRLSVDLPENSLVPRIPQKLNYLLWIEDLLALNSLDKRRVHGIDIGTGASCIYSLLGARKNHWDFVATDVDETSLATARANIVANELQDRIRTFLVEGDEIIRPVVDAYPDEKFTFTLCNPPFFSDEELNERFNYSTGRGGYSNQDNEDKHKRRAPNSSTVAKGNELATEGGEVAFVGRIIAESTKIRDRVRIFTVMLGKKSSKLAIRKRLSDLDNVFFAFSILYQGKTIRWVVAWTFATDISLHPDTIISEDETFLETKITLEALKTILEGFRIIIFHQGQAFLRCEAQQNTWNRKRRLSRTLPTDDRANVSKAGPGSEIRSGKVEEVGEAGRGLLRFSVHHPISKEGLVATDAWKDTIEVEACVTASARGDSLVIIGAFSVTFTRCADVEKPFQVDDLSDGPSLAHFISASKSRRKPKVAPSIEESDSYLAPEDYDGQGRLVKLITYGCQMNENDMELVRAFLVNSNYRGTDNLEQADIALLMTCSIREGAEAKVWRELMRIRKAAKRVQTVGVLGCMAERIGHKLFEKRGLCDVVAGPDSYRDLPRLLAVSRAGNNAINVQLSLEETYAEVAPVRKDENGKTAFVSIMRGCDNMCTYCIVPFTRGKERSRPIDSIVEEVRRLSGEGVRQITLLGQNVNSYRDFSESTFSTAGDGVQSIADFRTIYKPKQGGRTFLTLLDLVSRVDPMMRIRFTSPHPKDFPTPVLDLIAERSNICNQIHLPAQSGSDAVLETMGRGYTRDLYMRLVADVRAKIPNVALTSDFIAGFCGETEEQHQDTLQLIRDVKYDFCYVFPYSMREKTKANRQLRDDVPEEIKKRRHIELSVAFREEAEKLHASLQGGEQTVLVEGHSKRSTEQLFGRVDGGTKAIFPAICENGDTLSPGDYVKVKVVSSNSQTLFADALQKTTTL
ncbi:unnamed protein product, partial [Mesorhabditis spiculigera]